MTQLKKADVVAWVAAIYRAPDAEQRVVEGRAAYQVRLDDGSALLVRKRTGEYWAFPRETDLHTARSDWGLRHRLRKVVFDLDQPTGVVHDPGQDLTMQQLTAWLDGRNEMVGQILDRGWAFLAIKGPVMYGGPLGAMLAVGKHSGEVWDLYSGTQADAALNSRTEAGFRSHIAAVAPGLQPIARIPR